MALTDGTPITEFRGPHRFLSNFAPCRVEYQGLWFLSVEAAYQAAKMPPSLRHYFETAQPSAAKQLARTLPTIEGYLGRRKEVMRHLLEQKFRSGSVYAVLLLSTGSRPLIEVNTWGDRYWGVCNGDGLNNLGLMLMGIRSQLRTGQTNGHR